MIFGTYVKAKPKPVCTLFQRQKQKKIIEAEEESTGEVDHRKRTTQATSSKKKKNHKHKRAVMYLVSRSRIWSFLVFLGS